MSKAHSRGTRAPAPPPSVDIELSLDEVEVLLKVASRYHRSLQLIGTLVRFSSSADMREKARFVKDESYWLRRFMESTRVEMQRNKQQAGRVRFTSRSLVAFWGRMLWSLNNARSRRRLSSAQIDMRGALALKLEDGVREVRSRHPSVVEEDLQTRRPAESAWMREALSGERLHGSNWADGSAGGRHGR